MSTQFCNQEMMLIPESEYDERTRRAKEMFDSVSEISEGKEIIAMYRPHLNAWLIVKYRFRGDLFTSGLSINDRLLISGVLVSVEAIAGIIEGYAERLLEKSTLK